MANWKENGVVPDSEDEDDLDLETQSDTDIAIVHTNEQNESHQSGENGEERGEAKIDGILGIQLDNPGSHTKGKELDEHENHENREDHGRKEIDGMHWTPSNNTPSVDTPSWNENHEIGGGDISEDELALTPVVKPARRRQLGLDNGGVPASSPSQPPVFKIPSLKDDSTPPPLEILPVPQLPDNSSGTDLPTADDISTSYVRISSPNSSPLSSLPDSPDSQGSKQRTQFPRRTSMPIEPQNGVDSATNNAAIMAIIEDSEKSRRSFRQRNPIQLHPYMLEQEKYRQTLKDRGVKPMRITQTQEEKESNSRDSVSPVPESQNTEVDAGDSQLMDFDWDIPSSPPEKALVRDPDVTVREESSLPTGKDSDEGSIASDNEFPDVNELLRKPKAVLNTTKLKSRLKKYSLKNRTKSLITRPTLSAHHEDNSIFDIPVSPPVTGPPFDDISRAPRNTMSRTISLSPAKDATPNSSALEQRHFRVPAGIRTPATSAIKPPSRTLPVDSDLDEDNPFASEHDISQTNESSSEESVDDALRKKIRGVLPASHLRLNHDSKRPEVPSTTRRQSFDAPSTTPQIRRGVAIPKTSTTSARKQSGNLDIPFLSDESEDENESYSGGFVAEDDTPTALDMIFNDRQGSAAEESTIDRMLPTQKRTSRITSTQPRKRRRTGIEALSRKNSNVRQPKITEHLRGAPQRQRSRQGKSKSLGVFGTRPKKTRKVAPRLSILDAADYNDTSKQLPQFVRIAARAARSRKGQGRHSPTKKFIRMSNREDTLDVQSVLQDWRRGKIQPKNRERQRSHSNDTPRRALQPIAGNKQTKLTPSTKTTSHIASTTFARVSQPPRRLFITKPRQTSIAGFVTPGGPVPVSETPRAQLRSPKKARFHQGRPHFNQSVSRPAQLESTDIEHATRDSESFFKTSKRSLDVIFRDLRRRHGAQANPQLGRFLSDPSIRPTMEIDDDDLVTTPAVPAKKAVLAISRRKKNLPTRVDVDAAEYRQPSEPIVIESLPTQLKIDNSGKLQGLGKFGTRYPIHFDILPLNNSVYFHESSFIGSGRLSEVISGATIPNCTDGIRNSFTMGNKVFRWDQWNETVSSEIGVCFDWMIEQACGPQLPLSNTVPASAIDFVGGYIQHHVVFRLPKDQLDFLSRMFEVFGDILARLDGLDGGTPGSHWIEIFTRSTIVVYQLLRMARNIPDCTTLAYELEDLLKRFAKKAARLLVADGLDNLRGLYDDLQYLSFREMGLKNKQFAIQGWVILIKVLDASQMLRGTFWDIVNPELSETSLQEVSDVPAFEKLWYSMFTLLPLFAFDELGIVKTAWRNHNFSDNWAMPQKLLKRIFEIYTSKKHQPPGFNDYCRANIARCHYLMVEWGWWKCSGLIGTIFDFFASQKLAHLRNEEVYDSPKFLRELNTEPSLNIEREDRCFHIFLKVVGLAIRRMGHGGDVKSVRNLVTRLLPNHDRNFPKEESISHHDLASLRNHHDLLCTLYWAAPAQQRPAPTEIQDLVVADRSHNEACLINLRAWENLTRFVVSQPVNISAYHPFTNWQNSLSTALAKQYLGTEVEVRAQAESLFKADKEPISDSLLRGTIAANKRSTMEMLRVIVKVMDHTVTAATSSQMAILAFNPSMYHILNLAHVLTWNSRSSNTLLTGNM